MPPVSRLNRGQRIIVVVGLGVALWFAGGYVTTLGNPLGWVAYAPLSKAFGASGFDLTSLERLLVWLGLVTVWMIVSVVLLGTSKRRSPSSGD
jgi:hypothetical protein